MIDEKRRRIDSSEWRPHDDGSARDERHGELPHRGVERERRCLKHALRVTDPIGTCDQDESFTTDRWV